LGLAFSLGLSGCRGVQSAPSGHEPVTLRIGFGLAAGAAPDMGIAQTARNIVFEELLTMPRDGRALPGLADRWSVSPTGLELRLHLRSSLTFDNGRRVTAPVVCEILRAQLAGALGPAFGDIDQIRALSDLDLEVTLRRRSAFLVEAMSDVAIVDPATEASGTGPFQVSGQTGNQIEMRANANYYGGKPPIDRIKLAPYQSVRAAWADLLRGQVDMLYEVGVDALDSLEASNEVNVFAFQRSYAYLLLLNLRNPVLRDPKVRRALNVMIDRRQLIDDALRGHGTPAWGPVSPFHWAHSSQLAQFEAPPAPALAAVPPIHLTILFAEPSLERLALMIQRQFQEGGLDITLESVPGDQVVPRLRAGHFDAVLSDYRQGPNVLRSSLFWYSDGPDNYGGYHNVHVDRALDRIRHAADDAEYAAGVVEYQQAIVDDPPAVFLAWRERARAVSRRFVLPADPGADVLATIHLWRPTSASAGPLDSPR
jgi:peptide/nickel transport system substrate-binding protein